MINPAYDKEWGTPSKAAFLPSDDLNRLVVIGEQKGRLELAIAVNGWALKHASELSTEGMRSLMKIITQEKSRAEY